MRILVNDFAGHSFQVQLSRALARSGHTVLHTYFGANNTPKGAVEIVEDGLVIDNIVIANEFKKHSLRARRAADIQYGNAVRDRITGFQPDLVISANTPLDAQRILLSSAHSCDAKFVFWLQDLLSVGIEFVLRKKHFPFAGAAGYLYRRLERRLLQQSDAIVCIAPEFRATLEQWRVTARKTFVIENWAPLEELPLPPRPTDWALEHGVNDKFCFMYSGTLGMKHKPELLLELARRLEPREDVVTVVVAEGAGAEWLQKNQNRVRPGALKLLPFQPYERVPEVLASADVLITLLDEDCGAFAVPSKTLAYLCAGRPLLVAAPTDNLAARTVRRAGAGIVTTTELGPFLSAAGHLIEDPETCSVYGEKARQYAERAFDIDRICRNFLDVFDFAMCAATSSTMCAGQNVVRNDSEHQKESDQSVAR